MFQFKSRVCKWFAKRKWITFIQIVSNIKNDNLYDSVHVFIFENKDKQ